MTLRWAPPKLKTERCGQRRVDGSKKTDLIAFVESHRSYLVVRKKDIRPLQKRSAASTSRNGL